MSLGPPVISQSSIKTIVRVELVWHTGYPRLELSYTVCWKVIRNAQCDKLATVVRRQFITLSAPRGVGVPPFPPFFSLVHLV